MSRSTFLKIIIPVFFVLAVGTVFLSRYNIPRQSKNLSHLPASGNKSLSDFYNQSKELAPEKNQKTTVSFLAAGDIMLSRNVAGTIKKAGDVNLPFRKMEEILKSTNFNFANLESPISGSDYFNPTGSLVFNAPPAYAQGLSDYNFSIVNLANNHAFDQGFKGLQYTVKYLDEHIIQHIGTGSSTTEAWQPAIVNANGIKIGFIGASFSSLNDGGKVTNDYVARIEDLENLKSAISNLKSQTDFIVVTMHAGTEYTRNPNQAQKTFAHKAIDYGADMVIGAHPHWVQTVERYCPGQYSPPKIGGVARDNETGRYDQQNNLPPPPAKRGTPPVPGGETAPTNSRGSDQSVGADCPNPKYIFYSLGNFIFDQMWSQDTKEGLTLKIQLSKAGAGSPSPLPGEMSRLAGQRGCLEDLQGPRQPATLEQIEMLPVIIDNYSTPRPATPEEAKKILEKIGEKEAILYP